MKVQKVVYTIQRLVGHLFVGHAPTHMIWSKPNAKNKLEVI